MRFHYSFNIVFYPFFSIAFGAGHELGISSISTRLSESNTRSKFFIPFQQQGQGGSRILFMGESTCLGYGAEDRSVTVAGYFGADFRRSEICNYGRNGYLLRDVSAQIGSLQGPALHERFDLAVNIIGGNDTLWFTPISTIVKNLHLLLDRVQPLSHRVILVYGGNLGELLIMPSYMRNAMRKRSSLVNDLFQSIAIERGVLFVNGFFEHDLRMVDPANFCPDLLHPCAQGYKHFYNHIRYKLDEANIILH